MIWCCQEVHQYLDESYRSPTSQLVTLPGLCLSTPECHIITCSCWHHPIQALTGKVPDISHFLHLYFREPASYKVDENGPDHKFHSQSNEKGGHWVGFVDNKCDQLTWNILAHETQQMIARSAIRSATKTSPNLRLNPPEGEDQPQDLTSEMFVYDRPCPNVSEEPPHMSILNLDDMLGGMVLLPIDPNGEEKSATISDHVHMLDQAQFSREEQLRFKVS